MCGRSSGCCTDLVFEKGYWRCSEVHSSGVCVVLSSFLFSV